jgi:hypothetical protein
MLCSVLLPSRARPEGLLRAVRSLYDCAADPTSFEILVRLDDDDLMIVPVLPPNARVIWGDRLRGYRTLNLVYSELASVARGDWVWIFNDDCYVTGERWDEKLAGIGDGFIVQPEIDQNGGSSYHRHEGGPFPCVPNNSWAWHADPLQRHWAIGDPVDIWLDDVLRKQRGWKTAWLPGITIVHERPSDEELAKHRAL